MSYAKSRSFCLGLKVLNLEMVYECSLLIHWTSQAHPLTILEGISNILSWLHMYKLPLTTIKHVHYSLQWHHNKHDGVSNHQPHECLLNCLFRRRSKKASKLRVTGLCAGNSPVTGEFPAQTTNYTENISIWWRHHAKTYHSWPRLASPAVWCMAQSTPVFPTRGSGFASC